MAHFSSKYGVARHIYINIPKAGSANHAVGADWTPAAGDVKISKDGGAAANVTNLPTAIAMGNSAIWDFSITATEMQAAQVNITVSDSATKAVDDTGFVIETYGNASAQHEFDLDTASVTLATSQPATTFTSLTVTGTATISDGLVISRSTSNASAITATGNGTGSGAVFTSGSGATGDGIQAYASSTNGRGFYIFGNGSGAGIRVIGGATGAGLLAIGGASSGAGINATSSAGNSAGVQITGNGTGPGFKSTGGATGSGILAVGGATSGHGIEATVTSGNEIDANITGNITGTVTTIATLIGTPVNTSVSQDIADIATDLRNIANVGAAVNVAAESYVLTTGTQTSGTYASTAPLDGVYHTHTDTAGAMDLYYQFDVTNDGVPTTFTATGYLTGGNDSLGVYAYNWSGASWDQIGTRVGSGATTNTVNTYALYTTHVGTGANLGKVRIRYYNAGTLTTASLNIDQAYVSYAVIPVTRQTKGSISDVSPTSSSFNTDMTQADNFWNDALIEFTSGALRGQTKPILSFANTNGAFVMDEAFTSAPANGDNFIVFHTHIHPVSQIANGVFTTQMTESYRADLAAPTLAQGICETLAHLGESSISGTTKTIKKFDGTTTAETFTLDDATTPTSITRAT